MREQEWYFGQYPIGMDLVTWGSYKGIHRVVGHLVGKWLSTERPWYALACETVYGDPSYDCGEHCYEELKSKLIIGSLPSERTNMHLHVLNGNGSYSFCKVGDVKMLPHGHSCFFYWRPDCWLYHEHGPSTGGYHEPPEPEENWISGTLGYDIECDDETDESQYGPTWLVDCAWYLRNHAREVRAYPVKRDDDPYQD